MFCPCQVPHEVQAPEKYSLLYLPPRPLSGQYLKSCYNITGPKVIQVHLDFRQMFISLVSISHIHNVKNVM